MASFVIARDNGICHVCGQAGADEADHVIGLAFGGLDDVTNMAAIHARPCHLRKTQHEAAQARWRERRARDDERHPGAL